jgi:hypothetical protein
MADHLNRPRRRPDEQRVLWPWTRLIEGSLAGLQAWIQLLATDVLPLPAAHALPTLPNATMAAMPSARLWIQGLAVSRWRYQG